MEIYAKPKKSLGQNFLTSVGAVKKIVDAADYEKGLTILEIGPGRGVLTAELVKKFDRVISIEKDHELIAFLKTKFANEIATGKLKLIEGDILELDPAHLEVGSPSKKYSVVANIPYYITGQFLRQWLALDNHPKYMVLMLQKEVAQRIAARDDKESLLSMSVKVYGEPKYIETVKRGSFYPIPNVDSAILKIGKISKPKNTNENAFFSVLKAGFAHKRKFLISNLGEMFSNKEKLAAVFKKCDIDPKTRPEDLKLEGWMCLAENL